MVHLVFLRNSGSFHSSGSFGSGVSSLNLQYNYKEIILLKKTYHSVDLINGSSHVRCLESHSTVWLKDLSKINSIIKIVSRINSEPLFLPFHNRSIVRKLFWLCKHCINQFRRQLGIHFQVEFMPLRNRVYLSLTWGRKVSLLTYWLTNTANS